MRNETVRVSLLSIFSAGERGRQGREYWLLDTASGIRNLLVHQLLRTLPVDVCSGFGALMGQVARHRYAASDKRSRELFLRLHRPSSDPKVLDAMVMRLWRGVGRTMAEMSVLDKIWDEGRVSLHGADILSTARKQGQRVIVLGVHTGNWELIGRALIGLGYKGAAIYQVPKNRFEHWIVQKFRGRYGGQLIPQGALGARVAYRSLFALDGILMSGDEFERGRVYAPEFGRPRRVQGNLMVAARLAGLAGAQVVPAYCLRRDDTAWFDVYFLPPVELIRDERKSAALAENYSRLHSAIEPLVRENLEQWFYALDFEFEK